MYQFINDLNLYDRPCVKGPSLNFSRLRKVDVELPVVGFSIHLVTQGREIYKVNGTPFNVDEGRFLLLNSHGSTHVVIDSPLPVEGVCIELTNELIDEALAATLDPEGGVLDHSDHFFTGDGFIEHVQPATNTSLGRLLQPLAADLAVQPATPRCFPKDLYHAMAEAVVQDHMELLVRARTFTRVRTGTRKDLFRRIQKARELIHDGFQGPLEIAAMAREACMSEYHFYRMFKAWTGYTPHTYLVRLRLSHAHALLVQGGRDITDVALSSGFPDIHSFSRAFKRAYGIPPSAVRGSRRICQTE
jgi:AraC family transcriptional regulator